MARWRGRGLLYLELYLEWGGWLGMVGFGWVEGGRWVVGGRCVWV